jgi:phosphoenolpyruvate carboxykinase (GTP)
MGDYFGHWLSMGDRLGAGAPKVFYVNWFRRGQDGLWLWPGFGENSRVLKWICQRVAGGAAAADTPIGRMPTLESLDLDGLKVGPSDLRELLRVDRRAWRGEVASIREHFAQFGDRLPARLAAQLDLLAERLEAEPA